MVGLSVPSPHAAAPAIAVPSPGASPVALSASSASSQAISASSGESAGASPMPEANITAPAQLTPNAAPFVLADARSEEHTSELQSLMRISYAVFCLKKKKKKKTQKN